MPRRKVLKVVVDVTLNAVTCPGVVLPDQTSVFLNVDVFGECKKTECLPAVFPFLFHEKMRFEKTFHRATDPVQVANALAADIVRVELVQLSYPAGELLACYQENAREFLFPTPRVSPAYPGVDREVLLNRAEHFPGIAPKLEFSSRTAIKEVNARGTCLVSKSKKEKQQSTTTVTKVIAPPISSMKKKSSTTSRVRLSSPSKSVEFASTKERGRCGGKNRKSQTSQRPTSSKCRGTTPPAHSKSPGEGTRRYRQSTISSRARSPSPYARRRMAQLSVQDPFESAIAERPFRTELEDRPDFVVRRSPSPTFPPDIPSCKPIRRSSPTRRHRRSKTTNSSSPNHARKSRSLRCHGKSTTICPNGGENNDADTSLGASYRPRSAPGGANLLTDDLIYTPPPKPTTTADIPLPPSSLVGSILHRTPLRERYYSNDSSPYLEIRDRVRGLLPSYDYGESAYESEMREARLWGIASRSSSAPRSPVYGRGSFDERVERAYEDIYDEISKITK